MLLIVEPTPVIFIHIYCKACERGTCEMWASLCHCRAAVNAERCSKVRKNLPWLCLAKVYRSVVPKCVCCMFLLEVVRTITIVVPTWCSCQNRSTNGIRKHEITSRARALPTVALLPIKQSTIQSPVYSHWSHYRSDPQHHDNEERRNCSYRSSIIYRY